MADSKSTVSLKLLIDTKRQKVLFAEAGKDFVDFLFTLLSLPVGTVIRLLSKDGMVGSFGKLYDSVENLDLTYMEPKLNKDILLKPKAPVAGPNILGLLDLANVDVPAARNKVFYMCSKRNNNKNINRRGQCNCSGSAPTAHLYVTEDPKEQCPKCNHHMSSQATYVGQPKTTVAASRFGAAGYVKGLVTYIVMDDLEVKPMSTISSITLLNRFNVKNVGTLEQKVVDLGMNEGVKLLKESLQSKAVLTNVFLVKKAAA
ncbi:hypothetical protein RchiOBHm_Chr5g0044511 [Rosa chinensis]|uniref:DUF674 domain-containing protein n=1 Tax=Rosa chinensis TaxID=74649 RepID=A0A2P6QDK8_ROSCH|nr:uncharacterized protein LOC112203803 [Rosa chinensis]PRQ32272.1 hypothetical protein RchiOBHm_Chr5g0044511 [Rosa chinensis]